MSSNVTGPQGRANFYQRRGLMLVLSAPSGAGKTTLTHKLLAHEAERCMLSVSATTRQPRPTEVDGQHYLFLTRDDFIRQQADGAYLEWAEVFGNFYGTPRLPVEQALGQGCDVVFDIDWQGAQQLAANAPGDVVRVFILPPSRNVLEDRLRKRASDTAEVVARRMAGAAAEIAHWNEYDYVIVNDDLEASFDALLSILAAERLRRSRCPGLGPFVSAMIKPKAVG